MVGLAVPPALRSGRHPVRHRRKREHVMKPATKIKIVNTQAAIGHKVYKFSGKPFKSRQQENTVTGVIRHPQTGREAFTFKEDDSYVEVQQCGLTIPELHIEMAPDAKGKLKVTEAGKQTISNFVDSIISS